MYASLNLHLQVYTLYSNQGNTGIRLYALIFKVGALSIKLILKESLEPFPKMAGPSTYVNASIMLHTFDIFEFDYQTNHSAHTFKYFTILQLYDQVVRFARQENLQVACLLLKGGCWQLLRIELLHPIHFALLVWTFILQASYNSCLQNKIPQPGL